MVTEIVGVLTVIGIVFKVFKVVGCLGKGFTQWFYTDLAGLFAVSPMSLNDLNMPSF